MATIQMVFSAHVVDDNGRSRSCHAYQARADTTTLATLLASLESFGDNIANLSDGRVDRLSVHIADTNWTPEKLNSGGAPIEQTGLINFSATGTSKRWALAIPAFTNARLIGDRIDPTYVEFIAAALTSGNYTNDHGQLLSAWEDALLSIRRDRKQLQRASLQTA